VTEDTKKTVYWTMGSMAALIAVVVVLWMLGVFTPPAA
jgi:hypothetical protein